MLSSALADLKPENVGQQRRHSLESDPLREAQIDDEGPQIFPERRALGHIRWWLSLELLGATRADVAIKRHPRHVGLDRRNFDMVVSFAGELQALRTSAPQCWQACAAMSRLDVGFECSHRCAPACDLRLPSLLAFAVAVSGVLGGRPVSLQVRRRAPTAFHTAWSTRRSFPPAPGPDGSAFPCRANQAHRESSKA